MANEGLGRDSLLKLFHNPGGDFAASGVDLINCLNWVKPTVSVGPSFLNVGNVASSGHTNQTKKNGKNALTFTSIRSELQALEMPLKKKHR